MKIQVNYNGLADRQIKSKEQEAKGLRMLFDNFDPDWNRGDIPHGTMTFTDEPALVVPVPPPRDLEAEIDELKIKVAELENKNVLAK